MEEEKIETAELNHPVHDRTGNFVICQECGQKFKAVTPAHLKNKHNITWGEYQLKYPGCPMYSKSYYIIKKEVANNNLLFKDKENLPKESIETIEKDEKKQLKFFKLNSDQKNKQDILNYLVEYYPNLENNYVIEKFTIQGHLEYKFTVDMADPIRKTIFDFPNAFWHNTNQYPDHSRNLKLREDNWIVIKVTSHYPTIIDVKKYTDNIIG